MLPPESLKSLLAQKSFSRSDKMLLCLGADPLGPKSVGAVRDLAVAAGLRAAKKWNVSQILQNASPLAARTSVGWELTDVGEAHVAELAGPVASSRPVRVAAGLRHHLASLASPETRSFLEEAVASLERGLLRSAVVLSWVGAVSVLQDHVVANQLSAFNTEASRRDARWKAAKTKDDLGTMKETEFLNVLQAISIIGKNVKQELEGALKLRNGCGHPNSLVVGEARAAAHVETLMLNVFSKF